VAVCGEDMSDRNHFDSFWDNLLADKISIPPLLLWNQLGIGIVVLAH